MIPHSSPVVHDEVSNGIRYVNPIGHPIHWLYQWYLNCQPHPIFAVRLKRRRQVRLQLAQKDAEAEQRTLEAKAPCRANQVGNAGTLQIFGRSNIEVDI